MWLPLWILLLPLLICSAPATSWLFLLPQTGSYYPTQDFWPWLFPRERHRLLLIPQIFAHNETFPAFFFFISFIVSNILSLYISICSISIKECQGLSSVLFPDSFPVHILCSVYISWSIKWASMSHRTTNSRHRTRSQSFPSSQGRMRQEWVSWKR